MRLGVVAHTFPYVLKSCAEFIETHGIVDGIYRLSGVTSNIQRLSTGWAQWLMPVIPALWEAKAVDHLRSGVRDQPGQHGETLSLLKTQKAAGRGGEHLQEFGSDQCPDLTREVYLQDIHCVGSLCKLYFRELPNPLLTYELYEKFTV
ncbi:Rho GTPase-activating protein 31 [Plecturocebus cupreus]